MRAVRFIGPAVLLVISLLMTEVLLRILPSPVQYPSLYEFDDPQSLLGLELVPNTQWINRKACFTSTVTTNSAGWRDREHDIVRTSHASRIAVLGDSYMEGVHVNDDQIFARQLEAELGENVEVLNFGLSTIGTVQEDILYEHVVAAYDPDIVIVAFYANDVANNDHVLEAGTGGVTRLTYRNADGSLVSDLHGGMGFAVRKWLRVHSAVFRLLKQVSRVLRSIGEQAVTGGTASYPRQYGVYAEPTDGDWLRAWTTTEDALRRLRDRLRPDQQLLIFNVPDIFQVSPDPAALIRKDVGVEPPDAFDPTVPNRLLQQIARRLQIPFIDMNAAFIAYRDAESLQPPYFSFTCEGHWNSLGHSVAASAVAPVIHTLLSNGVSSNATSR